MKTVTFKEYQEILMNSFVKINEFFNENEIKWWAHSGTLLGAAREGGLIEWDDDIDMAMPIYEWHQKKHLIKNFLLEINWEVFDRTEINGLDATRMFSKDFIRVEYEGDFYITKPFIDIMIAVPKEKISLQKRKVWSWFNQYNFIFSNRYRLVPYYGWFGNEIKKISAFKNFMVFFQKWLFIPLTFWVPIVQKKYLSKKNYFSKKVAMYYNYDNNGVIYNLDKINTKHKFGNTTILSSDDWEKELDIWFGGKDKWKELPPEWNRVPHHLLLTKDDGKNTSKYKITPYIII